MERIIWLAVMIPVAALFTGIGVFAWKRKKPMWFNAEKEIKESEISDVPAYNRANGIMWLSYSAVFWAGAFAGFFKTEVGAVITTAGCIIGIPVLVFVYKKIYNKYKVNR